MAKTPEGIVEDYGDNLARQYHAMYLKFTSGITGVPDRILVMDGKIVFIELKAVTGRLSERQKLVIRQLRKHGAIVYVPYSTDDLDKLFEELSSLSMTQLRKLHKNDKI